LPDAKNPDAQSSIVHEMRGFRAKQSTRIRKVSHDLPADGEKYKTRRENVVC
jgi:hypothetical protein